MTQCWGSEFLVNKGLCMGLCFPRLGGSLSSPRVKGSKSLLPLSPAAPHKLQHFLLLDPEDKEEKMNFVSVSIPPYLPALSHRMVPVGFIAAKQK